MLSLLERLTDECKGLKESGTAELATPVLPVNSQSSRGDRNERVDRIRGSERARITIDI